MFLIQFCSIPGEVILVMYLCCSFTDKASNKLTQILALLIKQWHSENCSPLQNWHSVKIFQISLKLKKNFIHSFFHNDSNFIVSFIDFLLFYLRTFLLVTFPLPRLFHFFFHQNINTVEYFNVKAFSYSPFFFCVEWKKDFHFGMFHHFVTQFMNSSFSYLFCSSLSVNNPGFFY